MLVQWLLRDRIARGCLKGVAWTCIEHEDGCDRSSICLGQLASTWAVGDGRQSRSAEEELWLAAAKRGGCGFAVTERCHIAVLRGVGLGAPPRSDFCKNIGWDIFRSPGTRIRSKCNGR